MSLPADLIPVGILQKTHGYKGHFRALLDTTEKVLKTEASVFIEIDNKPVPFFITDIRYLGGEEVIIGLAEVTNREYAATLTGHILMAPASLFKMEIGEDYPVQALVGYSLYNADDQKLMGHIEDIQTEGIQPLLEVLPEKGRAPVLVPWDESMVDRIDSDGKRLFMHIPEGLEDL